jgi:hypothetical protein
MNELEPALELLNMARLLAGLGAIYAVAGLIWYGVRWTNRRRQPH